MTAANSNSAVPKLRTLVAGTLGCITDDIRILRVGRQNEAAKFEYLFVEFHQLLGDHLGLEFHTLFDVEL